MLSILTIVEVCIIAFTHCNCDVKYFNALYIVMINKEEMLNVLHKAHADNDYYLIDVDRVSYIVPSNDYLSAQEIEIFLNKEHKSVIKTSQDISFAYIMGKYCNHYDIITEWPDLSVDYMNMESVQVNGRDMYQVQYNIRVKAKTVVLSNTALSRFYIDSKLSLSRDSKVIEVLLVERLELYE